jgi:hypothetical protein
MLADDYHYIVDVRRAVDAFAEARGLGLEVRRSPRGEAILRRILTQTAGDVQEASVPLPAAGDP